MNKRCAICFLFSASRLSLLFLHGCDVSSVFGLFFMISPLQNVAVALHLLASYSLHLQSIF